MLFIPTTLAADFYPTNASFEGGGNNPSLLHGAYPFGSIAATINGTLVGNFSNTSLIRTFGAGQAGVQRTDSGIYIPANTGFVMNTQNFTGSIMANFGYTIKASISGSNFMCGLTNDASGGLGRPGETGGVNAFHCNGDCIGEGTTFAMYTDDWGSATLVQFSPTKALPVVGESMNLTVWRNTSDPAGGGIIFNNANQVNNASGGVQADITLPMTVWCYVDGGTGAVNFTRVVVCNLTGCPQAQAVVPPDTTPPQLLLINGTSNGNLGYIIYAPYSGIDNRLNPWQTNDSTPTFRLNTSESATCGITANKTNTYDQCTTTGAMLHTCTVSVDQPIGTWNFSTNCTDAAGNKNQTQFLGNVTEGVNPNVFWNTPTLTTITLNATDNYGFGELYVYRNTSLIYSNTSYVNNTKVTLDISALSAGVYNFSALAIDLFNNQNRTDYTLVLTELANGVGVFLDGVNDSRKYELGSVLNISANSSCSTCNICISLDAPNYGDNYSCGTQRTHFVYNATILRQSNFTSGKNDTINSGEVLNVSLNNRSDMLGFEFNISSTGPISSVNITYPNGAKRIIGNLVGVFAIQNSFVYPSTLTEAVNLSFTSAGANYFYINLSDIFTVQNLSFDITGFNLDLDNAFTYNEYFNGTGVLMNGSNSPNASAPMVVLDDFSSSEQGPNNWLFENTGGNNGFSTGGGILSVSQDSSHSYAYLKLRDMGKGDLRNTSKITVTNVSVATSCTAGSNPGSSANANFYIVVSDNTSFITFYTLQSNCPSRPSSDSDSDQFNFSIESRDYSGSAYWEWYKNGVSQGFISTSSLDYTKPITLMFGFLTPKNNVATSSASATATNINISGAGINRTFSTDTYGRSANYTSGRIANTNSNLKRILITPSHYNPDAGNKTNITYYVSNTCNQANPIFEQIVPGEIYSFINSGTAICWRAKIDSTLTNLTPRVKRVLFEVIPATAQNVTVNIGDDSTTEFSFMDTLNSTTSPQRVNLTTSPSNIQGSYTTIKVTSAVPGQIQINNFKLNYTANPISLNERNFEGCNTCPLNFTYGGANKLNVYDLKVDFLGSWNYTAQAKAYSSINEIEASNKIMIKYSKFNCTLPRNVQYFEILPLSNNQTNITVLGQKINYCNMFSDAKCVVKSTPVYNCTNYAYDDPIDISLRSNISIPASMNFSFDTGVNRSSLTTKQINNLSINLTDALPVNAGLNSSIGYFAFVDFYNVSVQLLQTFDFNWEWRAYCSGCVR